ncbi:acylphosphatase [Janibacter cremeus]|uniref:acylphosphatase n=1 Tax=Janibacter cremeus TaxID=1285192 RepID=A0A852VP20_9MICO|nr:acylphosphatase [Janibacter cremeus]NYF97210.1 acylphosphatase [Janibacter cremeus]
MSPEQIAPARATWFVRGRVQGVGFRWWTRARALESALVGHARNMDDGRVEVVAEGPADELDRLDTILREEVSTTARPGRVTSVVRVDQQPRGGIVGFVEK